MTKNITFSVKEDILKKVRILATKRDTTVNAIVRDHLEALAKEDENREDRRIAALKTLKEMSSKSEVNLGKDFKFDRESLYDERVIR